MTYPEQYYDHYRKTKWHVNKLGYLGGSHGGSNLGDETALQRVIARFRVFVPMDMMVFSQDPEDAFQRHGVEPSAPVSSLTSEKIAPETPQLGLLGFKKASFWYDGEGKAHLNNHECSSSGFEMPYEKD